MVLDEAEILVCLLRLGPPLVMRASRDELTPSSLIFFELRQPHIEASIEILVAGFLLHI